MKLLRKKQINEVNESSQIENIERISKGTSKKLTGKDDFDQISLNLFENLFDSNDNSSFLTNKENMDLALSIKSLLIDIIEINEDLNSPHNISYTKSNTTLQTNPQRNINKTDFSTQSRLQTKRTKVEPGNSDIDSIANDPNNIPSDILRRSYDNPNFFSKNFSKNLNSSTESLADKFE